MPKSMFNTMDAAKAEAQRNGLDIIDLSIGSSDLSAPKPALDALRESVQDPETHGYCLHSGTLPFRQAAAQWFFDRYGYTLDPETSILSLIGSQEGFAHLLLALTDPGDSILVPDPGYPSYFGAIALAGLDIIPMPLLEKHGFLPDFSAIPEADARRAKVMVLSYPNNPTASVADDRFFDEAIEFCAAYDVFLIHDFPYVDMVFGSYEAPSALARPGAMDRTVELYSCSKSYHMGGFRIGWAAGNPDAIQALCVVKSAIDFNQYSGIQQAAIAAIRLPRSETRRAASVFEQRRNVLVNALNDAGISTPLPQASMYVWTRLPEGFEDSFEFTVSLARNTGVCLAPGRGFGERGEGFVRFALVRDVDALRVAVGRMMEFIAAR